MKKIICAFLVLLLLFLCGCSSDVKPQKEANVMLKQINMADGQPATVDLGGLQAVNRLVLEGENLGERTIEIYDEENRLLYQQRSDSDTRFCAFNTVQASQLQVIVRGGDAVFNQVSAYHDTYQTDNFRVVSYVVADRILDKANLSDESFDVITDVILFSCVSFDEKGNLFLNDFEDMDGETLLNTALQNLRGIIGDRSVRIHLNILGPNADEGIEDWNEQMANKAQKHSAAFETEKLEAQIKALAEKTGVDGIFFDYEFPIKSKYWKPFNEFLVRLDTALPDKLIGLALADWDIQLSKEAKQAVDMVEMMEYDLFDDKGDHASFATAETGIQKFLKAGFEAQRLDLGVPFYGRPVDKGGYWYEYKAYVDALGQYENKAFVAEQNTDAYFDSYQRVYDKTALALEYGLGGMMVWHYTCDDFDHPELSLFQAMKECIENRSTEAKNS